MNNKFINYNGETLLNTKKNKKTKVESQIELLKNQEQVIIAELNSWEVKDKKVYELLTCLAKVEKFGTVFLTEVVSQEKEKENLEVDCLEHLIKNKTEFNLQLSAGRKAFYQLVWRKIEFKVGYLKSQLRDIQSQLRHQQRLFTRIEIRRQGRTLLECKLNNSIGCLGVYQCANCQTNYAVDSQQFQEVATP